MTTVLVVVYVAGALVAIVAVPVAAKTPALSSPTISAMWR